MLFGAGAPKLPVSCPSAGSLPAQAAFPHAPQAGMGTPVSPELRCCGHGTMCNTQMPGVKTKAVSVEDAVAMEPAASALPQPRAAVLKFP